MKFGKMGCVLLILTFITISFGKPSPSYFSRAQLHPNCLKVEPTQALSAEWGLQLFAGAHFYIPFGSTQALHQISKLISAGGDSQKADAKKSEGSSNNMCALVRIKGFKLEMEGQDEHFLIQDCAVITKGVNHCVASSHSENPDAQKQGDGIFTIVWTDNESSMAVVRCTSDGLFNDWYVFSKETSLNDTVKSEVLSSVTKLGFPASLDNTISPSYEGCKLFNPNEDD